MQTFNGLYGFLDNLEIEQSKIKDKEFNEYLKEVFVKNKKRPKFIKCSQEFKDYLVREGYNLSGIEIEVIK